MRPKIDDATWPYIDRFFREVPEAIENLPSIRSSMQEAVQEAVQEANQAAVKREQHGWHRTLLMVLQHKFGPIPPEIARQIEQITDVNQFDRCLNQALTATSLADLPWLTSIKQ